MPNTEIMSEEEGSFGVEGEWTKLGFTLARDLPGPSLVLRTVPGVGYLPRTTVCDASQVKLYTLTPFEETPSDPHVFSLPGGVRLQPSSH